MKNTKDREQTANRIIEAVGEVLARDGSKGLGINNIAKQAGVDKVLIYRYFGNLPELVRAFGTTGKYWPSPEELMESTEQWEGLDAHEALHQFFKNYVRAMRSRPLTLEIMAWEHVSTTDEVSCLEDIRIRTALECFERMSLETNEECDLTTVVVMIFSAINSLLVKSMKPGSYGGLNLSQDITWQRIDSVIAGMLRGAVPVNQ
ncbi:TetR/AcrR family transcriptional regulator [Maridesulfovibrio sp.]|uniref:TetR/AcrR family transcriptional regulator n=1 Tax=unclassified Maridesulfovibrio TaxID=2794999 RepID=UPI003AFF6A08